MIGVLRTAAGVATPLLSGGYLCDLGDAFPIFAPTPERAWDVLTSRTTTTTAARRNPGEGVGAAWEAAAPTSP